MRQVVSTRGWKMGTSGTMKSCSEGVFELPCIENFPNTCSLCVAAVADYLPDCNWPFSPQCPCFREKGPAFPIALSALYQLVPLAWAEDVYW